MHLDVLDLREFYYRTRLGRAVQGVVRRKLLEYWPDARGETVVGFGFAVPLLRPYLATAERVIGLMPGQQGVMAWPAGLENVSVLCKETLWPVGTGSVQKLVVMHGLETSDHASAVIEECFRVLAAEGRAVFIVPNRAGLWARRDGTPFGFGRPYTMGQLEAQLTRHGFCRERHVTTLYQPPLPSKFWMRAGPMLETMGQRLPAYAGGLILVEVSKQVPAPRKPGLPEAVRDPLKALEGIQAPVPKPV